MNCPYCNKPIRDGDAMVRHLEKTPICSQAHGKKLLGDLRRALAEQHRGPHALRANDFNNKD